MMETVAMPQELYPSAVAGPPLAPLRFFEELFVSFGIYFFNELLLAATGLETTWNWVEMATKKWWLLLRFHGNLWVFLGFGFNHALMNFMVAVWDFMIFMGFNRIWWFLFVSAFNGNDGNSTKMLVHSVDDFLEVSQECIVFLRVRWFVSFLVYFDLLEGQRVFGGLFVQACRYSKKLSRYREPGKQCEITGIKVNVQWNHPQIAFFQPCFERICL